jgi:hypothetical protein
MDDQPSIHLMLVGDRAKARRFYVDRLAFDLIAETRRGLLVGRARQQLMIGLLTETAPLRADRRLLAESLAELSKGDALHLSTENCVAAFFATVAGGAQVVRTPAETSDGALECLVRDPWGNLLRLVERQGLGA